MCVIIVGSFLPEKLLRKAWDANPDGAGFWTNGKVYKGFMNFSDFLACYRKTKKGRDTVAHFRIATHGPVTPENCHPFYHGETVLFHNGIVDGYGSKDLSDSREFFEDVVIRLDPNSRLKLLDLVADATGSKFCLIQNKVLTIHGDWHAVDDCFVSNTFFQHSWKIDNRWGWERDMYIEEMRQLGEAVPFEEEEV